jgi:hypothetical protein
MAMKYKRQGLVEKPHEANPCRKGRRYKTPMLIIALKGKAKIVFPLFAIYCKRQGNKRICELGR